MAVTVDPVTNGDFTRIDRADSTAGWSDGGSWAKFALNTTSQVENTGCMESTRVDPGIGIGWATFTSRSLENVHLRCWSKLAQNISSTSVHGARLIIGDDTDYGEFSVYGSDKQVIVYNGWMMLVADPRKQFDGTGGTVPTDITAVVDAGISVDFLDANGKALAVLDMLWEGNETSIEGGTTGARGTFAEWSADDLTNGYGILRNVGGVYFLNAGAVFQDVGTADSYFQDSDAVIVFEDLPVSGSIYKFRHVGNSTGTNHFQLGTSSGTGTAKEGTGGGVLRAAGLAPFRIEAIDTNTDVVGYYGVTMLGNINLYDDQFRNVKVEDNGTGFTDITSNANGGTGRTNPDLMPTTQALNDATYYGHDERFYELNLNLAVAKGGTWTGTWEYYDGSTWSSLTDLTDATNNYTTTGTGGGANWSMPDDWTKTTIDSDNRYWVRFRISSFTSSGTTPTMNATTGITCAMAGDIRIEDSSAEIISCNISGMGSIRVRNGAFLKKTTIDGSIVPSKHAAVDLGGSNPTTDTVRDLVIQNCSKGILLQGSGDVSYTLQNITFAGNTNDVRVDFGGGDTVTINVSGGDSPTVDNVNSSTVNIINTKTLTVNVKDTDAVAIPYAKVRIENSSTGALISEGIANNLGVYVDSNYNYVSSTDADIVVRKNSPGELRYLPVRQPATITGDLTATIQMTLDSTAGVVPSTGILRHGVTSENESGDAVITSVIDLPNGTSRKLLVSMFYWDSATNLTVSSITYDGNAMTSEGSASAVEQEGAGNYHEMAFYYYDIPDSDSGQKTISATWSANVAIKAIAFAIVDDAATGSVNSSSSATGDTLTSNPTFALTNSADAWSVAFLMVDDTDSPSATGVSSIRRSDLVVDGLKSTAILVANRVGATGIHSLGADYGANNKTWVIGGVSILKN